MAIYDNIIDWVEENPGKAAAIGVGGALLGRGLFRSGRLLINNLRTLRNASSISYGAKLNGVTSLPSANRLFYGNLSVPMGSATKGMIRTTTDPLLAGVAAREMVGGDPTAYNIMKYYLLPSTRGSIFPLDYKNGYDLSNLPVTINTINGHPTRITALPEVTPSPIKTSELNLPLDEELFDTEWIVEPNTKITNPVADVDLPGWYRGDVMQFPLSIDNGIMSNARLFDSPTKVWAAPLGESKLRTALRHMKGISKRDIRNAIALILLSGATGGLGGKLYRDIFGSNDNLADIEAPDVIEVEADPWREPFARSDRDDISVFR